MATKNNNRKSANNQQPVADNTYARLQPQALEIERAVLGALMIDKDAFGIIANILHPEDFYEPRNQKVFSAILELANAESSPKPVDVLTVTEQLAKNGNLEEVGGPGYVAELSSRVASSANIDYHANIIAQKSLARKLIQYAVMVESKAFDETTDIDDLMQEAEEVIFRLSKQHIKNDFKIIDSVLTDVYKELDNAAAHPDGIIGIPTGYPELDNLTSGWQNSDLVILAGRPSMGKTTFAICTAKYIAIDLNIPVAFFSLEMSNTQLVKRLLSNTCQVQANNLRNGRLGQDEWARITKGTTQLIGKPFFLDDTPGLSVYELRNKARRLVKDYGVKIIFIDYLQLMTVNTKRFNTRQDEVSLISRSLKGLAKELEVPIIALSQMNRGIESREGIEGKRPQLSDLRESGAIEQDADMVLFVHRPEYYNILQDENGRDLRGLAELIIGKQRNGETGKILMTFQKEFTSFVAYDGHGTNDTQEKDFIEV